VEDKHIETNVKTPQWISVWSKNGIMHWWISYSSNMSLYQPLHLRWAAQCLVPLHLNLLRPNPFFEAFGDLCYSHPNVSGFPFYYTLNLCKMKYNILNKHLNRSLQNQFTWLFTNACMFSSIFWSIRKCRKLST